jgi:hypothetical protein
MNSKSIFRNFVTAVFLLSGGVSASAGVVNGAFATDSFPSSFNYTVTALPAFTGLGGNVNVGLIAQGTTTVDREINAFIQNGVDTIDTQITSSSAPGTTISGIPGLQTQIWIGNDPNRPGLSGIHAVPIAGALTSNGQVQENTGTPINGQLNVFPAKSIFDVFFDVWIDKDNNGVVNSGEILRNFNQALRVQNLSLDALPPKLDLTDPYTLAGWVALADPLIGSFGATVNTSLINLFVVNNDGTNSGVIGATIDPNIPSTHTPNPEPASLSLIATAVSILGYRHWRRKTQQPA